MQKLQNRSRYDQTPDCSLTHDPGMVYSDSCLPKKLNDNHLKLIQVSCFVSYHKNLILKSCCYCCSVTKLYPTLCDPIDCSTPGFPVLCSLPELAQVHTRRIGDAIQPSHPLSPLLPLPSIFPSISVFSNELAAISTSSESSGLIS